MHLIVDIRSRRFPISWLDRIFHIVQNPINRKKQPARPSHGVLVSDHHLNRTKATPNKVGLLLRAAGPARGISLGR